jgi:hypothetical protein
MGFSILEMLNMIRPMKLKLALAVLFLSSLAPWCAEAAINSAPPSAQIQPILAPCLDAILAPLEANPRMPRVQVETLRANFAASLVTATTPAEKNIYVNAMAVCDAMASDMDARANAQAAARVSAKEPALSTGGDIIASANARGRDAGGADQAIREKQKDERAYEDKRAKKESAFVNSSAYNSWVKNAPNLRQNVMSLFTRQTELEALYVKSNPPPAVTTTENMSNSGGSGSSSGKPGFGAFASAKGQVIIIKPDHIAVYIYMSGLRIQGTWASDGQRHSHIKFKHKDLTGDFSQDGKTFTTTSGEVFTHAG